MNINESTNYHVDVFSLLNIFGPQINFFDTSLVREKAMYFYFWLSNLALFEYSVYRRTLFSAFWYLIIQRLILQSEKNLVNSHSFCFLFRGWRRYNYQMSIYQDRQILLSWFCQSFYTCDYFIKKYHDWCYMYIISFRNSSLEHNTNVKILANGTLDCFY